MNGINMTGNDEFGNVKYKNINGGQNSFDIITSRMPIISQIRNDIYIIALS